MSDSVYATGFLPCTTLCSIRFGGLSCVSYFSIEGYRRTSDYVGARDDLPIERGAFVSQQRKLKRTFSMIGGLVEPRGDVKGRFAKRGVDRGGFAKV